MIHKSNTFRPQFRRTDIEGLPPVRFDIVRGNANGTYALRITTGGESAIIGVYPTATEATKARAKFSEKLTEHSKAIKREGRKGSLCKADRKVVQLYVMGLSPERRTCFLEGIMTFNFLIHMMTYCLDEAEGIWDGITDKSIRARWATVKKNLNAMLDELYRTRVAGETDDQYDNIAVSAQRMLDIVNILANYSGQDGQFRLVEVERVLNRVLPPDVLSEERKKRADAFQTVIADSFNGALNKQQ